MSGKGLSCIVRGLKVNERAHQSWFALYLLALYMLVHFCPVSRSLVHPLGCLYRVSRSRALVGFFSFPLFCCVLFAFLALRSMNYHAPRRLPSPFFHETLTQMNLGVRGKPRLHRKGRRVTGGATIGTARGAPTGTHADTRIPHGALISWLLTWTKGKTAIAGPTAQYFSVRFVSDVPLSQVGA